MTDDDAVALVPTVNEFVDAVAVRDELLMWACFKHTDPRTLAILCAEMLRDARVELAKAERVLHATRDINPAGVTRWRAWEIAMEIEERKSA